MQHVERRDSQPPSPHALREYLSPGQRTMLEDLERFGWTLQFIRHPENQPSLPVVQPAAGEDFTALQPDGHLYQPVGFVFRKPRGG